MTPPIEAVLAAKGNSVAVTSTASCVAASSKEMLIVVRAETSTTRSFSTYLRKPDDSAVRRYVPGCRLGNTYTPASFVTLVRATPVRLFCAVTCTFGMRAPVGSRMVPDNVAFVLCAEVDTAINRNRMPHHLFISCSSTNEADSIKRKFLSLLKPDRPQPYALVLSFLTRVAIRRARRGGAEREPGRAKPQLKF